MIHLSRGYIFPVDKSHILSHYFLLASGINISKVRWKELHSRKSSSLVQNTCCWRSNISVKEASGILLQMRSKNIREGDLLVSLHPRGADFAVSKAVPWWEPKYLSEDKGNMLFQGSYVPWTKNTSRDVPIDLIF